jgi:hypothetical protein
MKKMIALAVVLCISILAGCAGTKTEEAAPAQTTTIATEAPTTTTTITTTTTTTTEDPETVRAVYILKAAALADEMIVIASKAEEAGNMILNVWYNTIWETSDPETDEYTKTDGKFNEDFNDSLLAYFNSSDYILNIGTLKERKTDFLKKVRELSDHPDDCRYLYEELKNLQENVSEYCQQIVIAPSGSYRSYSAKKTEITDQILNEF